MKVEINAKKGNVPLLMGAFKIEALKCINLTKGRPEIQKPKSKDTLWTLYYFFTLFAMLASLISQALILTFLLIPLSAGIPQLSSGTVVSGLKELALQQQYLLFLSPKPGK